jgi:hypothetical protein
MKERNRKRAEEKGKTGVAACKRGGGGTAGGGVAGGTREEKKKRKKRQNEGKRKRELWRHVFSKQALYVLSLESREESL